MEEQPRAEVTVKTIADRQRAYRQRLAGTPEVRGIFAHPEDHPGVKDAALKLARKRNLAERKLMEKKKYRAAYYTAEQSTGVVLTAPEHAEWSDAELIAQATAEAHRAGLIGPGEHQVSEVRFAAGLRIGPWQE